MSQRGYKMARRMQAVTRRERPVLQGGENAVNLDYLDLGAAR
jgi:hypothetical protein